MFLKRVAKIREICHFDGRNKEEWRKGRKGTRVLPLNPLKGTICLSSLQPFVLKGLILMR